jgi:phosphoribosylaminoimidazole-succinocarboxamide synthase
MIDEATLQVGLDRVLEHTDYPALGQKYEGKVRDNYSKDGTRTIIVTDRVSAFDRVLGTLPFKGQVLNQLAAWWFEATRAIAPNHMLSVPDPNVMVVTECDPLPVEMVVRGYLTGVTSTSIWTHYSRGDRVFCGHALPEGLRKHDRLPRPILTPSTKAHKGGHDVSVSRDELLATGILDPDAFEAAEQYVMALFAFGQELCASRGLILVDTKYELGRAPDGSIVVIDEVHTPDSSRFWFAETYEARMREGQDPEPLDKEYLRRWLAETGFQGDGPVPEIPDAIRMEASRRYIDACEAIRGEPFVPNLEPPTDRIAHNLAIPRSH